MNIEARPVELPAKDPAEFIAQGGTADQVRALIAASASAPSEQESEQNSGTVGSEARAETKSNVETAQDGTINFAVDSRQYRIRGLSATGLDRLRVNVRITVGQAFHLDTLDLYQARARALFAQSAAKLCSADERQVGADLLRMVERLEAERLQMRRAGEVEQEAPMTGQERQAALDYLKSPKLCESGSLRTFASAGW